MVDTWTEKDEQEVLAVLARKAKLLNPDRRVLVDALTGQLTRDIYVDPLADMLIERAAEFRRLLEPFDAPRQGDVFAGEPGWIEWRGAPRPERANTRVEVVMRNGRRFKTAAGDAYWVHGDHEEPEDIMRYRVIS